MPRAGVGLVDVELVEDDAPPSTDRGAPSPGRLRLATRVPRRAGVAAAVVGVAIMVGTGVSRAAVDAELDARLAGVDGLTSSLAAPLHEAWRVGGAGVIAAVDDVVVLWGEDGPRAVGTDVSDGSARYVVPGFCQLVPIGAATVDRDVPADAVTRGRPGDVLLCVEDVRAPTASGRTAGTSTARVVDPVTGTVRHSIELGAPGSWDVVGGDLVSIAVDREQHVTAGRWSLETGRQQWAYRGARPAPTASGRWETSLDDTWASLRAGLWSVTIDVATGKETRRTSRAAPAGRPTPLDLPGGGSALVGSSPSAGVRTTVQPPGDAEPFTVDGIVVVPTVDDGSAAGTVLVRRLGTTRAQQRLALVDVATGRTRWTSTFPVGRVAVLSGLVLVTHPTGTTGLDVRTGRRRWTAPAAAPRSSAEGVVTDGRRLLVLEGEGEVQRLVARGVDTGAPVWSLPTPVPDAALVPLPDGTVLAVGHSDVVALRP